jgi:hypothetical protein
MCCRDSCAGPPAVFVANESTVSGRSMMLTVRHWLVGKWAPLV